MKLTKTVSLLVLAALAVAGSAILVAQRGPGQWGGHPAGPGIESGFGFHPGMMRFLGRALDLTEEQQSQIQDLMRQEDDGGKEQRRQNFSALREIQKSIREATTAEEFNAQDLRTLYQQRSALLEEGFVKQKQLTHDVFRVLTEEQRQKALDLLDEARPRFGRRGFTDK
jgi:Spy/CpxP family protein refolding chaperone